MKKFILLFSLIATTAVSAQMTTQGVANALSGGCDCYQITPNVGNVVGAIWSPTTIDLSVPQDLNFQVNMGSADGGGDGMVFVLQTNSTGIGTVGNSMAYNGITNSVGVEIDTYGNVGAVTDEIWADHIGISSEGGNDHSYGGPVTISGGINIEDGAYHDLQILWDPTAQTLGVLFDGAFIVSYTGDIVTDHFGGDPNVYFGFTGSTGGAMNDQRVCMTRTADFTASMATTCPNVDIDFSDASTSDLGDINITNWDWDFDDDSTSTMQNPTHSYDSAGTYTVTLTMTDATGCTSEQTMDIEVLPPLEVDSAVTHVDCYGDSTGMAVAIPTTGTGPYAYLWDDPMAQTDDTANTLMAGTYSCTVTDDLGCTGQTTVTITEGTEIVISGSTTPDSGGGDGSVDITVSGGTPGTGGYTFDWSPSGETTEDISGVGMGTHTVTVTDSLGCMATADFFVDTHQGLNQASKHGIKIFPNPTEGILNIQGDGEIQITIHDLSGKIVYSDWGTDNFSFNLSGMQKGVYLMKVQIEDKQFVERIILK